ncbi:MAG: aldolase/citrate lyase family protein [Xanthobacteraceae bacterium]|nr:aldolase/citrate lyase family protein [Xanthobacteraceae bacterium]PWB65551.1 MAG: hpch/hpai aldolase [Bradyrhizobiaceae bacterium]
MPGGRLRDLCASRDFKFGHFVVEFATPGIGHILKGAGCEFVLFDTEHSGFSTDVVRACVRYFEAADLPAVFRVPSKSYDHLARYADMGGEGIMVPLVNDAREAKELVSYVKYFPDGHRGVGVSLAHDNYTGGSVPEKLKRLNARNCLFVQIETAAGAENAEEIAAVPGVDCLWVGHFDLSCSLGIPGEFAHPKFTAAIDRITAAARKHDKALGRLVTDIPTGLDCAARGFDFLAWQGDVWALQGAVRAGIEALKAGIAARAGKA